MPRTISPASLNVKWVGFDDDDAMGEICLYCPRRKRRQEESVPCRCPRSATWKRNSDDDDVNCLPYICW